MANHLQIQGSGNIRIGFWLGCGQRGEFAWRPLMLRGELRIKEYQNAIEFLKTR
jgi:hypothetical protein